MRADRQLEMQMRMIRSYRNFGIAAIVMAVPLWAFMPFALGIILALGAVVLGILSIARASSMETEARRAADAERGP